ncbi:hypothetical protein BD289DRAFT_481120 [Coniella lustricola]|uniref:DUF7165 domain-containing protein n=1 Tax=Coniella lustricola TaxID=2025994 RepID=A0A2T3AD65_9PEZI|nr:hypothetical protein BD289DRAFT_481120 [Coniella lustricola]
MSQVCSEEVVEPVEPVKAVEPPVADELSPRRPSIEKAPIMTDSDFEDNQSFDDEPGATAFHNLPEEIIQQILLVADPDAFASLIVLNSIWRRASQRANLYEAQLMKCPSYSTAHKKAPDARQERLPELRKLFAREVKRNLFTAYLRPNHTEIKLVSNSISSSSCPGGDGMSFSSSPKGHYLLAYNSSRIHILDVRGPTITVERELKILRRPAATCIKDDGSLLAVLLTEMQVDLYDLTKSPPKHSQSIILDHSPRAIALSPCGSVLAAAYEGGIEVQALNPGALATERRSVKCDGVDALAFSLDGTQILGTTVHSAQPNTVILTAPYYDPGAQMSNEDISALWTTSILFPNSSRDCSHAVLLQESSHEEAYWTITYDRSFETFRAVRIDDLRNGTTYFTGPISNTPSKLLPCTLPSASDTGELVAAGFQGKEVWLYGVPEDLEAVPDNSNNSLDVNAGAGGVARSMSGSSIRPRPRTQDAGECRVPQWLLLCDKNRNTFVGGFKTAELSGVSMLKWVASYGDHSLKERLIITAKGATPAKPISMDDDGMDFEDGGRLTLVDFDYRIDDGCVTEITIEVGMQEPEVLEEERRDLETEVAIVRRRTVAQKRGNRSVMMRAATTAARPTAEGLAEEDDNGDDDPLLPRRAGAAPVSSRPVSTGTEEIETNAVLEEVEALDGPYSHAGPRSITTLRRAATAAANHRQRNPTIATGAPIEYRRADGRAEHPHESDADNWVPPPPPYQKEDPGEAPVFLRHSMMSTTSTSQPPTQDEDVPPLPPLPPLPPVPRIPEEHRPSTSSGAPADNGLTEIDTRSARRQTYMPDRTIRTPITSNTHHRLSSYPAMPTSQESMQASSSIATTASYAEDDIYNVSPPDTPRLQDSVLGENRLGNGSDVSQTPGGFESNPSPSVVSTAPYTGTQRSIPLVPRIQTVAASTAQSVYQQPLIEHAVAAVGEPSPAESTWNPHTAGTSFSAPLVQSQTWPIPSPESQMAHPTASAGHPLTAPATSAVINEIIAQAYPPPPIPASLVEDRSSRRQASLVRRISNGFHLPRMRSESRSQSRSQSRSHSRSQSRMEGGNGTVTTVHEAVRPRTAQSLYQRSQTTGDQQPPFTIHGNYSIEHHNRQTPDQPMIISTPTGIQALYDAPTPTSLHSTVGTQIIAPVPRHPRPGQSPGAMRPAERLESMYYTQDQGQGQAIPDFLLQPPPVPQNVPSEISAARTSSIFRRPSRAERSAAKNIADAKKKGWRPGRSKSKRGKQTKPQEPEFDMMSQSTWTDVTMVAEAGRSARGRHPDTHQHQQRQQQGRGYHGHSQNEVQKSGKEKDKKCVVM